MTAATETKEEPSSSSIEQWDLTSKISPFLDRHMMFPLLEYLDSLITSGKISYSSKDVAAARLSLLRPTHMVDYAIDIHKTLHPSGSTSELEQQKKVVYERLEVLRNGCKALEELCQNQEERSKLTAAGQWSVAGLASSSHKITPEMVETYRQLAKYNFECGDYKAARDFLENYISLFAKPPPPKPEDNDDDGIDGIDGGLQQNQKGKNDDGNTVIGNPTIYYLEQVTMELLPVLWGKLACEILVEDWEAARVALDAVKLGLESLVSQKQITALQALHQRTWLLHWSLFVYWNTRHGMEHLVDLFHSERYRQAITTNAPHLVRYLTAAVLLCKRRLKHVETRRRTFKNLIQTMSDCAGEYTDPIVEFVHNLCVKFDFDAAQVKLAECQGVLETDFFLCQQTKMFMEEARVFVFENYCRIHTKIDLQALGDKLAMAPDQAERWIVDLIRNTGDLDAKIDAGEQCVVMNFSTSTNVYEQVLERTRDYSVRSATLAQNFQNVLQEARKEKAKQERAARED